MDSATPSEDASAVADREDSPELHALRNAQAFRAQDIDRYVSAYVRLSGQAVADIDEDPMRLMMLIARTSRLIANDMEWGVHRPHGLSHAAFYVAAIVWLAGPLESSRVASIAGITRSAASAITHTLVRKGWVTKTQSETDRRSVSLSISPMGGDRLAAIFREANARERRWVGRLTDDEQSELARLLLKVVSAADD